jgi:hypothetical protein
MQGIGGGGRAGFIARLLRGTAGQASGEDEPKANPDVDAALGFT